MGSTAKKQLPKEIGGHRVTDMELCNIKSGNIVMINNDIVRYPNMSGMAKYVYVILKTHCYDTDVTWIGQETIGELAGIKDTKTVRKYLNELKEECIIAWDYDRKKGHNYYLLLPMSKWKENAKKIKPETGKVYDFPSMA